MGFRKDLGEHLDACFSGVWVTTQEPEDATSEVRKLCAERGWDFRYWDIARGIVAPEPADCNPEMIDPVMALNYMQGMARPDQTPAVMVTANMHLYIDNPVVLQNIVARLEDGRRNRVFLVNLSPAAKLPLEVEKAFVVLNYELPTREELLDIAKNVAQGDELPPEGLELDNVLGSAAGLTRMEAEGAVALSIVRNGRVEPRTLWGIKSGILKKSGLLDLWEGREAFAGLNGLDELKGYTLRTIGSATFDTPELLPKGQLLLGVAGTGKSTFAKALGKETGRPVLCLDVGRLMGGLVGETEGNVRRAFAIADAMAPCVLFVDELEKALSGAGSSGKTDSGVGSRTLGTFLTWMENHTTDVYMVATCNDITSLAEVSGGALLRRFDSVWFLDMPSAAQREGIWKIHLSAFRLNPDQPRPNDDNWTGAEIKKCCLEAARQKLPLVEAARYVIPVNTLAAGTIDSLRRWASGRCSNPETRGIWTMNQQPAVADGPRRALVR